MVGSERTTPWYHSGSKDSASKHASHKLSARGCSGTCPGTAATPTVAVAGASILEEVLGQQQLLSDRVAAELRAVSNTRSNDLL